MRMLWRRGVHRVDARHSPQLRDEEQRSSSRQQRVESELLVGLSAEARLRPPGFGGVARVGREGISTVLFPDRQTDVACVPDLANALVGFRTHARSALGVEGTARLAN